jgi:hypothetical protein
MRTAVFLLVSLIGFLGLIGLVGYFLPVSHQASRSVELNQPPDVVWRLVADPDTYRRWWSGSDVKTVVVDSTPPARLVTKIVGETQFGGTWTLDITPIPTGSRITVTEHGEIYNVVFRALAKYVLGYTGTIDSFLEALKLQLDRNFN